MTDLGRQAKFVRGDVKGDFFTGVKYNLLRSFVLNSVMIRPYMAFKEYAYNTFGDTIINTPVGLFFASLVGTALVLPIDNMRTRMMAQYKDS